MLRTMADWLGYGYKAFVLGKELPYLLGLVVTDRCNLDCFYCESKNSGRYHISLGRAKEILRDAYARGHRYLYLTGGEPMMWDDDGHGLEDLVWFARAVGFDSVFVYTNGTMPLEIENCSYIVTVDGPREVHNKIRGGTYDLIMKNVSEAPTGDVYATITFSKANGRYLARFVEEVSASGLFKGISFNLLTHWPEIVSQHGLPPDERERLLDDIWALKKKGYPIALSRAAYKALRNNDWKRPIPQIELATNDRTFTCCRDVDNPSICEDCGYAGCAEISQVIALKPTAIWQAFRLAGY